MARKTKKDEELNRQGRQENAEKKTPEKSVKFKELALQEFSLSFLGALRVLAVQFPGFRPNSLTTPESILSLGIYPADSLVPAGEILPDTGFMKGNRSYCVPELLSP